MSRELEAVKRLRREIPPASAQARDTARSQLRALIEAETSIAEQPGGRRRRRFRGGAPGLGTLVAGAASLVSVAVVVGVIVLLGRGHAAHDRSGSAAQAAIRGDIVGTHGLVLAGSASARAVQITLARLPRAATARATELEHLAAILGLSRRPVRCRVLRDPAPVSPLQCDIDDAQAAGEPTATVATEVSARTARAVAADAQHLPGVSIRHATVRTYPHGNIAAQTLGEVSPTLGPSGLEAEYNRQLTAGDTLKTSLNAQLQLTGEQALAHAISTNHATGGAFVAMDPQTGAVYALGSSPTFDPASASGRLSPSANRKRTDSASGQPLLNRAVQSAGPTGSAFKPITALAALQSGAWRTDQTFDDTGQYCTGGQCRHNSGHAVLGAINLPTALKAGSDDFFYDLGAHTNEADPNEQPGGGALDQWARAFGIGQSTGIDLPDTTAGTLPTPRWRAQQNRLERECDTATGPYKGRRQHPPGGCGIADGTNRPWSVGDNESLAVGQGDVQISPLQLAVAYAAIANGGDIVQPHLATAITTPGGSVIQAINPPAKRHLNLNAANLSAVRRGLRNAASQAGGTSDDVFGSFPQPVYGQAGTAQYINDRRESDYAWYAGYVPASATSKPIVVVVWVQQGGFGDVAAAPAARQLLSQWLLGKKGPWQPGSSTNL